MLTLTCMLTLRCTLTLTCIFNPDLAVSELDVFESACAAHNPCNASDADVHDCHSLAMCEDTVATAGPGTHDCVCNPGTYGDGFNGTDNPQAGPDGCTLCPANSDTSSEPYPRERTDCSCLPGFTTGGGSRQISDESQECVAVECPDNSDGPGAGSECECSFGFVGEIAWDAETNGYAAVGEGCVPICPETYSYSHDGVFETYDSDVMFGTAADESATVPACKDLCDSSYGCMGFSATDGTNSSAATCYLYSANATAVDTPTGPTCLKAVAPCPVVAGDAVGDVRAERAQLSVWSE